MELDDLDALDTESATETGRLVAAWTESQHHESVRKAWQHLYPLLPFPGFDHSATDEHGSHEWDERTETPREWRQRVRTFRLSLPVSVSRRGASRRRLPSGPRTRRVRRSRGSPARPRPAESEPEPPHSRAAEKRP
jgi:hypothetical protein